MVVIKSKLTGQPLLYVGLSDGEVHLSPAEVRGFLESMAESPLRNVTYVRCANTSNGGPVARFLGGAAVCHEDVDYERNEHGQRVCAESRVATTESQPATTTRSIREN